MNNFVGEAGKKFVGYNNSLALANLDKFKDAMGAALNAYAIAYTKFMSGLYKYWGSPRGRDFSLKYAKFKDYVYNSVDASNALIRSATMSVASIANACGSSFRYGGSIPKPYVYTGPLLPSLGGPMLIDSDMVNELLDEFNADITKANIKLFSVPSSIAVYDRTGSISSLYHQNIDNLKGKIDDLVAKINTDIKAAVAEQDQLLKTSKAKVLAVLESLNG